MIGTIVNALAIVCAGIIGLLIKKVFDPRIEKPIMQAVGLSVFLIGLSSVLPLLEKVAYGGIVLLVCLVLGMLIGTIIDIDKRLDNFGKYIENKVNKEGFSKGFINASLIFCVGAMAIIGAFNDGLLNDPNVLFTKSAIDFITAIVLTTTLGFGVAFSAISVFIYQGLLTVGASFLQPILTPQLLDMICMVGYTIVMCIGINFLEFTKIKTANLLPAMFIPILIIMF